jgi:hypothetical protein
MSGRHREDNRWHPIPLAVLFGAPVPLGQATVLSAALKAAPIPPALATRAG